MDATTDDSRVPKKCVENGIVEREAEPTTKALCTEIIVVRHGETEWNTLGKMQGQTDIDLNEVGRQQAVTVAKRLSRESYITAIYSSDLKRALETAQTIAFFCSGLQVVVDNDLRERHIGELQGLTYDEAPKVNPTAFEALKSGQEIPGGGESPHQIYNRCTSSLHRIAEKHRGARVVVVTHGAVIEMLYKRVVPGGCAGGVYNTSISIIQLFEDDIWSIKLWNDISHLRETEFLESASGGDEATPGISSTPASLLVVRFWSAASVEDHAAPTPSSTLLLVVVVACYCSLLLPRLLGLRRYYCVPSTASLATT